MLLNKSKLPTHDAEHQLTDARRILKTLIPFNEKIYRNKASLFISRGFDWAEEIVYYVLAGMSFVFLFVMNSVFPFYILGEIVDRPIFRENISHDNDINTFHVAVKGLVVLIGLLFILLGFKKSAIRAQRRLLNGSAVELKKLENYFREKEESLNTLVEKDPGEELPAS